MSHVLASFEFKLICRRKKTLFYLEDENIHYWQFDRGWLVKIDFTQVSLFRRAAGHNGY